MHTYITNANCWRIHDVQNVLPTRARSRLRHTHTRTRTYVSHVYLNQQNSYPRAPSDSLRHPSPTPFTTRALAYPHLPRALPLQIHMCNLLYVIRHFGTLCGSISPVVFSLLSILLLSTLLMAVAFTLARYSKGISSRCSFSSTHHKTLQETRLLVFKFVSSIQPQTGTGAFAMICIFSCALLQRALVCVTSHRLFTLLIYFIYLLPLWYKSSQHRGATYAFVTLSLFLE